MAEYSFDVVEDDGTRTDGVRREFRHARDAKAEAAQAAMDMARDMFAVQKMGSIAVEVKDSSHRAVARARVMFACEDLD